MSHPPGQSQDAGKLGGAPSAIQISVLTCPVSGRCHILPFFPFSKKLEFIYLSESIRGAEGEAGSES